MTDPISSVRRANADKRVRGRRKADEPASADGAAPGAGAAPASNGPAPAAPIPPLWPDPQGVAAQILGQSDTAETTGSAKIAQRAATAYLGVEYSGGADRRHRQGRIAKTKI